MNETETLSPVLPGGLEEATRRLLEKACERELVLATVHFACAREGRITAHREEHFGPRGRGANRVAALEVAIEMMTEML